MLPNGWQFDAIGTRWQIDTAEPLAPRVTDAVLRRCEAFDLAWSRFRSDSLVSRIERMPGRYPLPEEAPVLLDLYRALYESTDGAVSPLVGRALEQLGYDSSYSLRPATTVSPVPKWEDAIHWDGTSIETVTPVVLDVGAAGKGYLVDLIGALLVDSGIVEFTIDASGDILHRADDALRVALEHPLDTSKAIGVATLGHGALCASASNRRAWPGAHHILDALTGRPEERVIATWVTAPTGLVADGLATALFFVDAERLAPRFVVGADFEYARMRRTGVIDRSPEFPGEIFA